MGDQFAEALSKGLKNMNPEIIDISDNRLSRIGEQKIIGKLKPVVRMLNASENRIDTETAIILGHFAKSKALK